MTAGRAGGVGRTGGAGGRAGSTDAVTRIEVGVPGQAAYEVLVGTGLDAELPAILGADVVRVAVVHPVALRARGAELEMSLAAAGYRPVVAEVPDGEAAKDLQVAGALWSRLGQTGFTRTDAVVAVGGGATTDLAGFVAASWLRGVRVVHLPTTLLGMVDAAIGGKTGINTVEGKNLVGAFHPPAGVLCDLGSLATLPLGDYVSGLAEVAKAGFIADPVILGLLEADPVAAQSPAGPHTRELVERAVRVKARVVSADLREAGLREILNYGHTFGHAIEKVEQYHWRHGAAVSVGMVFAAELARAAGRLDPQVVARHRSLLAALDLPTTYRGDRWEALAKAMAVDKKSRGDQLRFIVLEQVGQPVALADPDPAWLSQAYAEVAS
jgi:3-dehydroquinate synthase